jgi:hypothetical protein
MYFWLSFAGEEGFRGAAIVPGATLEDALRVATQCGLNPGGEVAGVRVADDLAPWIPASYMGKLLTADECRAFDRHFGESGLQTGAPSRLEVALGLVGIIPERHGVLQID